MLRLYRRLRIWVCAHLQGGHVYTGYMWRTGCFYEYPSWSQDNWICGRCNLHIQLPVEYDWSKEVPGETYGRGGE